MKALYLTADQIGAPTGGGKVTYNERLAMMEAGYSVETHGGERPSVYRGHDIPYLDDYFTSRLIDPSLCDMVHVYSGTFSQTLRRIDDYRNGDNGFGPKFITYTVPAHNRRATIEAHQRAGVPYNYPHIQDPDLWKIFSEGIHLADRVIVPSQHSFDALLQDGVPADKMVIIPHGIEAVPEAYVPTPAQFRVGYLGAVGPDKGLTTLIEAWGRLRLSDSELWLAGRGTEQLMPIIQRLAPKGKFRLLGYVEDQATLYDNVSVYCQPSITEAFGIEVLEAIAHGRPVIVSTGAGASDIVKASPFTGHVFPAWDVDALAKIIHDVHLTSLMPDPHVTDRRLIARQLLWSEIRPQYRALWESLL